MVVVINENFAFTNSYLSTLKSLTVNKQRLFSVLSQTFGLGQTNWDDKVWVIFDRTSSTHFGI